MFPYLTRKRPPSKNIDDRRGKPDRPEWSIWHPSTWLPPKAQPLDEDTKKSLDRFVSRKDRT